MNQRASATSLTFELEQLWTDHLVAPAAFGEANSDPGRSPRPSLDDRWWRGRRGAGQRRGEDEAQEGEQGQEEGGEHRRGE